MDDFLIFVKFVFSILFFLFMVSLITISVTKTSTFRQLEFRLANLEAELVTFQQEPPVEEVTINDKIIDLLEDIRDVCYFHSVESTYEK